MPVPQETKEIIIHAGKPLSRTAPLWTFALLVTTGVVFGCGDDAAKSLAPDDDPNPTFKAPLDGPAVRALEGGLEDLIGGGDPADIAFHYESLLDSLESATIDSLIPWGLSASVSYLDSPEKLQEIVRISRTLADSINGDILESLDSDRAISEPQGCGDPAVLYVNGISNTYEYYRQSVRVLRRRLRDAGINWRVFGAYNVSATDDERSVFGGSICPIYQYLPYGRDALLLACISGAGGFVIDFAEATLQQIAQWGNFSVFQPRDVARIASIIEERLRGRRGLVIVAHSQGNLMVNQAVELLFAQGRLTSDQQLRIVRVGSPTNSGPISRSRILDACLDPIAVLPLYDCLPTPEDCSYIDTIWACPHNFMSSYLTGTRSDALVSAVHELGDELAQVEYIETADTELVAVSAYRFGIEILGTVSCIPSPREVRATIYRGRLGESDPEREVLGPVVVRPGHLTFRLRSGPVSNCETYGCLVEVAGGPVAIPARRLRVDTDADGAGGHDDHVLFDRDFARGDWEPAGNFHHDRLDDVASTGSLVALINRPLEESNGLGVHRVYLVGGRIDELEPWYAECLAGSGPVVALTGKGRQSVRFVNDDQNHETRDVNGSVHLEVLDDVVNGRDIVEMSFTADPEDRFADEAQPGPFRAELDAEGVIIVLGR